MENADSGLGNPASAVGQVVQHLAGVIGDQMDRNAFFQVLTEQLRTFFHYDRCCINLYDAEREFLNLFTAADGTVVESLANTRVARNTVAGLRSEEHTSDCPKQKSALTTERFLWKY